MSKRKKLIIGIVIVLLVIIGIVEGKKYMTEQIHNQRIAERAEKLRTEEFEIAITQKLKEAYPDIKEIRFEATSKNDKTGFYWTTVHIITDWTENQPENVEVGNLQFNYTSLQVIQNEEYAI
ncbi:MAG: hypothetical protein LBS33_04775 [Streptococcaceae bacterium]|jgi:hypothetical protein|nr:hypothetical protein [Streptococcaceae bacterium]